MITITPTETAIPAMQLPLANGNSMYFKGAGEIIFSRNLTPNAIINGSPNSYTLVLTFDHLTWEEQRDLKVLIFANMGKNIAITYNTYVYTGVLISPENPIVHLGRNRYGATLEILV
jgi:hypothetical protein